MITAEIFGSSVDLEKLRPEWDGLYGRVAREPSVSFGWSRAIICNHLAGRDNWFIVTLRRDSHLVGVVPMSRITERSFGLTTVTLQPVSDISGTHSDLLLEQYSGELLQAWFAALAGPSVGPWDLLRLPRLLESGELEQALLREVPQRGWTFRLRAEQPSYYLRLPGTYAEYLAQRSSKFRNYLKRSERKLSELGSMEFTSAAGHDFDAAFEDLIAIERDSWKHAHGTAISAVDHQAPFYRDLARAALESGALHLTFLRSRGVAIAYNLGVVNRDCYLYLKTSYREQFKAYGAATVGRSRLMQRLIEEKLAVCDFPAEPYEWEKQWTEELRWHSSLLVHNTTVAAGIVRLMNGLRELSGSRSRRQVIHADPRALRSRES